MNYANILKCDIANGTGFRVSLFVSGCARHCKGCFNQAAQDPSFGKPFDEYAKIKIFSELEKDYCKGLSLLGGDPMSKLSDNRRVVIDLCKEVKEKFPGIHTFFLIFFYFFCCCCSVTQLCLTVCDPMDCSMQGFPVLHYLPEFAKTHVH